MSFRDRRRGGRGYRERHRDDEDDESIEAAETPETSLGKILVRLPWCPRCGARDPLTTHSELQSEPRTRNHRCRDCGHTFVSVELLPLGLNPTKSGGVG